MSAPPRPVDEARTSTLEHDERWQVTYPANAAAVISALALVAIAIILLWAKLDGWD